MYRTILLFVFTAGELHLQAVDNHVAYCHCFARFNFSDSYTTKPSAFDKYQYKNLSPYSSTALAVGGIINIQIHEAGFPVKE